MFVLWRGISGVEHDTFRAARPAILGRRGSQISATVRDTVVEVDDRLNSGDNRVLTGPGDGVKRSGRAFARRSEERSRSLGEVWIFSVLTGGVA